MIVFLNGNGPGLSPFTIRDYALDTLYGLADVPPTDYSTPPSTWTVYEGTYYDPIRWAEIRVELRGNTLWGTFVKSGWEGPFTQSQDDEFTIAPAGSGKQFTVFHREGGRKAEAMVFAFSTIAERMR